MLAAIKMEHGCRDCGYKANSVALDFDHVSGEKFMGVSKMGTFSCERIMAEVAKCEVVCFRCHRIREQGRRHRGELKWAVSKTVSPSKTQSYLHKYVARGRAFLASVKIRDGCKDCGYCENAIAMDFDHVRGQKLFNIGSVPHWSIAKLQMEIDKCEVVCANCHRIRTYERHQDVTPTAVGF
jgi:hypothetical protein